MNARAAVLTQEPKGKTGRRAEVKLSPASVRRPYTMLSMTPILMHSEAVPAEVRRALRAASEAPPEQQKAELKLAARALFQVTDLDCAEVKELLGLRDGSCS
jgi:hypothetical protein